MREREVWDVRNIPALVVAATRGAVAIMRIGAQHISGPLVQG